MEQELFTLSEHLSSSPVFSGVRVARSWVLCVCFVDRCLSFCTFSFGHCVVWSSLIYWFLLHLWYLQTLLITFFITKWQLYWKIPLQGKPSLYHSMLKLFNFHFQYCTCFHYICHCYVQCPLSMHNSFLSPFLLAILFSVLLRLTVSDYPFSIFKLFILFGIWLRLLLKVLPGTTHPYKI